MTANLCLAVASSKSDSRVVSACAGEGHRIIFSPKSLLGKGDLPEEDSGPNSATLEEKGEVQAEAWGNSLPLHGMLNLFLLHMLFRSC